MSNTEQSVSAAKHVSCLFIFAKLNKQIANYFACNSICRAINQIIRFSGKMKKERERNTFLSLFVYSQLILTCLLIFHFKMDQYLFLSSSDNFRFTLPESG